MIIIYAAISAFLWHYPKSEHDAALSSGSYVAGADKTAILINHVPRQATVQDALEGRTLRCQKKKVKKKK